MKKKIFTLLAIFSLATQLVASEATHNTQASKFYVIAKALTVLGDSVSGDHTFTGEQGYGIGIDLGYRIGQGLAVEYDFSYATNTVEDDHHHHEADAKYYTHALHLVYTKHLTHTLGLFVKGGYEYEKEEISDFHVDKSDTGIAYAIGLEYALNIHYTLVAEYEGSTIEGPRGAAVFAGIMYNF